MRKIPALLAIVLLPWAAAAQDPYTEFKASLAKARQFEDPTEIDKVVRGNPDLAMAHFTALCWEYRRTAADETEAERQSLREAYSRIWSDTTALEQTERFVGGQSARTEQMLATTFQALQDCYKLFETAKSSDDRGGYEHAFSQTSQVARTYEELGAKMLAAEGWALASQIVYATPERNVSDRRESVSALRRFVELRDQLSWKYDDSYKQNVAFLKREETELASAVEENERRVAAGYDPNAAGVEAFVMPDAEEEVLDLKFKVLNDMDEADFYVKGGSVPILWPQVLLTTELPSQLTHFKAADLYLSRPKASTYQISRDSSLEPAKNMTTEVKASNRPKPAVFHLDDAKQRPYAMWFYLPGDREKFMSTEMNMAATVDKSEIFFRSASSWTTKIGESDVTFYDDSGDGVLFAEDPFEARAYFRTLGEVTDQGTIVPAYDSMKVGSRGDRVPLSSVAKVGETWYHLRAAAEGGSKVGVRPLNPEFFKTGKVQLAWAGPKKASPQIMVIQGQGAFEGAAFDVGSGDEVEVPAGTYTVGYGRLMVGKGSRAQMAQVFRGESESFEVKAGETFQLEMGEPFRIEWERDGGDRDLKIDVTKLRVLGSSGAVYANLQGAVLQPDVVASRRPDGKGAKRVGRFVPVDNPDDRFTNSQRLLGREILGFPKPMGGSGRGGFGQRRGGLASSGSAPRQRIEAYVLSVQLPDPGMVVGIEQGKHGLFGKLLPVFKPAK